MPYIWLWCEYMWYIKTCIFLNNCYLIVWECVGTPYANWSFGFCWREAMLCMISLAVTVIVIISCISGNHDFCKLLLDCMLEWCIYKVIMLLLNSNRCLCRNVIMLWDSWEHSFDYIFSQFLYNIVYLLS